MPVLPKPPGTVIYPVRAGIPVVSDFYMEVGTTGLRFVAALQGVSTASGPTDFPSEATDAAYLRAGSTLARMGMVNGITFAFMRQAIKMSESDAATLLGVLVTDIQAWEAGITPIPMLMWKLLADEVCLRDSRPMASDLAITGDMRARTIRITPDIPQVNTIYELPAC